MTMCGICGKIANRGELTPSDAGLVARMIEALRHRGPDGSGQRTYGAASLGHVRLSIIDLATGGQPMLSEDEHICVVFNGEIYNFRELRLRLEQLGHQFASQSDTEVIIHAYEQYGEGCLQHFRGMFAFALWDERARKLFLARDRLGKKPLVYAQTADGLVFASELRALFADAGVSSGLDHTALLQYLHAGFIAAPATIYESVRKLPPAHYAVYENGALRVERYWTPSFLQTGPTDPREALEALAELLQEAVRLRMIADVPLGAFLSGGTDSTLVAALMSAVSDRPVRTFCIGFPDPEIDERPYAAQAARALGTEHEDFEMTQVTPELVQRAAWHYGEPYSDVSALPTFVLSQLTRRHVTVALNGDGGDEAFGGYARYYHIRGLPLGWCSPGNYWRAWVSRLPEELRPAVLSALAMPLQAAGRVSRMAARKARSLLTLTRPLSERYWAEFDVLGELTIPPLFGAEVAGYLDGQWEPPAVADALRDADADPLAAIQWADLNGYLPDKLLAKVDIASMASGLECRAPLLDHKVVEFAASLPAGLKTHRLHSKYLLREMVASYLPRDVVYRPKQGFDPPLARWLQTCLKDMVSQYLLAKDTSESGYFRREAVEALLAHLAHNAGANASTALWRLLMFEAWYRHRPSLRAEWLGE